MTYKVFNRYNKYNQCKVYKKEIYKGLMSIAWHPLKWWDWCTSDDKKKETEKLWNNEIGTE